MLPRTRAWRLRAHDAEHARELARRMELPELLGRLLVARGHREAGGATRHLRASALDLHDPESLPGMAAACERLARAIERGETILVHGDYDVDGVTGTALLMRLFRLVGAKAIAHIPNRLTDGYSFGAHSVARARASGAAVVISVDNGTSAFETIAELAALGIDVIVTDHHEPPLAHALHGALPPATAIVNPKLAGSSYPWRELCGGAVAFKLAWGLCQRLSGARRVREDFKRFLEDGLALVAIATVCDVVPLCDENRVFARNGLKALAASRHAGLRALCEVAGAVGRPLVSDDLGFGIGPRLNAAGRLGSAERAVELLLCEDPARARELAAELDALNTRRKQIEAEVLAQARAAAQPFADADEWPVLVVAGEGWHSGVVGIVAARLVEEFHRPAIVIGFEQGVGRGSGRTFGDFDVLSCLRAGSAHFARGGGHAQAVGLETTAECVPALRSALCAHARELAQGRAPRAAELWIDCEYPLQGVTPELMRFVEKLEPYGPGNEAPVLLSRDLRLADEPRAIGADGKHLVMRVRAGNTFLKALAFGMAPRREELSLGLPFELAYTPRWNHFRGEQSLELLVRDFRPSEPNPRRA